MVEDHEAGATVPAEETTTEQAAETPRKAPAKRAAPRKAAAKKTTTPRKSTAKKTADEQPAEAAAGEEAAPAKKAAKKAPAKKAAKKAPVETPAAEAAESAAGGQPESGPAVPGTMLLFQAPDTSKAPTRKPRKKAAAADDTAATTPAPEQPERAEPAESGEPAKAAEGESPDQGGDTGDGGRRRRRRGGRRRRKSGGNGDPAEGEQNAESAADNKNGQADNTDKTSRADKAGQGDKTDKESADEGGESSSSRRRRRRRRAGDDGGTAADDDPQNTVTKVRQGRSAEDQITALTGSTRLEAKKQRRREGREAGRRRAPIVSEAEFLARRESVDRVMAIRQRDDLTQIAVLEDKVLVEHYVARESQTSLIGNVYLGRVQNVLPSMEAAFIDIGKGRNAVLYAGEVNWSALGHPDGQPRKIESVLSSGQSVLVQVTKDPVGHKGARLTSQISLAGRFLVYVPDGTNSGISRKLPDTERNRLKKLLKEVVPEGAGVIVRTAAEGASEEELTRDVERLKARWDDISKKAKGSAPQLLYGEPDLMLKVVRDLFTEDFSKLVVHGEDAWDTIQGYVSHVAPDLEERLERYDDAAGDLFAAYRIDEQIHKGLDRKVWLPSGGSLIIDRTEAMTVVDVNTGKFTGSGGNLEETVTKNNLEAAEEIVRQLRLRDIGGIIVVDFIDMVLESNRDLVLRRLVECLGRDRTRHQVAEVTSLGLVQMTRKRIGTGLLEAFSETCEHCGGRGVIVADAPVEPKKVEDDSHRGSRRSRGRGKGGDGGGTAKSQPKSGPSPKDVAAMARQPRPEEETVEPKAEESRPQAAEPGPKAGEPESRAQEEPKAEDVATNAVDTPEPTAAPQPAGEVPAASAPPEPEPQAPKVVTRTRRRSASRPAGPPRSDTSAAPAEPIDDGTTTEPADQPGATDPSEGAGDTPVVEHVPVKRRGSRKR